MMSLFSRYAFCCQTVVTHQGMGLIVHGSNFFSIILLGCLVGLRSGEFGSQFNTSDFFSLNHSWTILAAWQCSLCCWKSPLPSGNTFFHEGVHLVSNNFLSTVGGMCQSDIHINGKGHCLHRIAFSPRVSNAHIPGHPLDIDENMIHQTDLLYCSMAHF